MNRPSGDQVGELVRVQARKSPERTALKVRGGPSRTYHELDRRSDRLAQGLLGAGLLPGDRVAAWMEDCLEYVELYLAVAKAGLVLAPINARLRAREVDDLLTDVDAALLVLTPGMDEEFGRLRARRDLSEMRVIHTGPAFERLIDRAKAIPLPLPDEDSLFLLGFTSGTTGRPKGAMLTHRSVRCIGRSNAIAYRLPLRSIGIFAGSMSFVSTMPAFVLSHLAVGGTVVFVGPADVSTIVDTIEAERGTYVSIASPRLKEFLDIVSRDPGRVASLQTVLHSASKAPRHLVERAIAVLGDRYLEGWGMTENSGGLLTATTRGDVVGSSEARDLPASVGQAVMDTIVELRDHAGRRLPHDGVTEGELVARSPSLMTGYWRRPESSASALRDGWYHTGDIGTIDPAGYVYILDRRSDLIVSGGMNVYPSEVEAIIDAIDGVVESAVFGLPHERWGSAVTAAVVVQPGSTLTAERIIEHCRAEIASFKKPTRVVLIDRLPRNASGKLMRHRARDLVRDRLSESPGVS